MLDLMTNYTFKTVKRISIDFIYTSTLTAGAPVLTHLARELGIGDSASPNHCPAETFTTLGFQNSKYVPRRTFLNLINSPDREALKL